MRLAPREDQLAGPNNARDFITIVPAGTPERQYKAYKYTSEGSPVELRAPEKAGDYEVRYLTGQTYATLATTKITVGGASATLKGPAIGRRGQRVQRHVDRPEQRRATSSTW